MARVTQYETELLRARLDQLQLVDSQLNILEQILRDLFDDIDELMIQVTDPNDIIRRRELGRLLNGVTDALGNRFGQIDDLIARGMLRAPEIVRDGHLRGSMILFDEFSPDFSDTLVSLFQNVPDDATRAVLSRVFDDGLLFSDRIHDLETFANNEISKTVTRGVLRRQSHTEMMRELEPFLKMTDDELRAFQRTWAETHDEAFKADWKTRGRLKYNLRRLARTEINNAYREGHILSARQSPFVEGVKWNLSGSHPKVDICDTWASQDLYDLGPGVYTFDTVPLDHPNGLCFLTNLIASDEKLEAIIRERNL